MVRLNELVIGTAKISDLASNEVMKVAAVFLAVGLGASCAHPAVRPQPQPANPQAIIDARLAEADALAARGCYICLREAGEAYAKVMEISDSPAVIRIVTGVPA